MITVKRNPRPTLFLNFETTADKELIFQSKIALANRKESARFC